MGIVLIILGSILIFNGALKSNQNFINYGIGGVFLGVVIISLSDKDTVRFEIFDVILTSYVDFSKKLINKLNIAGNTVYIPPYENIPHGCMFIPLHSDFDLDINKLDENEIFNVDIGREKEMGLVLKPFGYELMKIYEQYLEVDFKNVDINYVENISNVLRSLGIPVTLILEMEDDLLNISIYHLKINICSEKCRYIQCPICSSILLAICKSLNELIEVEKFIVSEDNSIKIVVRRMGGINEWI